MQLVNYGKVAATFVNRSSGESIRLNERHDSRDIAIQLMPQLSRWHAQRDAYQIMRDDQLFNWQYVLLRESLPMILEKHAVTCQNCGDRVNEFSEVVIDGKTLCKPCAFGAYFTPLAITPELLYGQSTDHQVYSHS
jgi:formylmethanofuran dehydrogenase subunit E